MFTNTTNAEAAGLLSVAAKERQLGWVKCKSHPKGHKSEDAAAACDRKMARRLERIARRKADGKRREAVERALSAGDYITREFCHAGRPAGNVAAALNRDYPVRDVPWTWRDVVGYHAEHHMYKMDGSFNEWLKANPEVMLPSELKKRAGIEGTDESQL